MLRLGEVADLEAEYIGQLEGELATKTAEADKLRIKNDQLLAENTRLTDLTRMLLSSPHFSNFLDELSSSGGAMPSMSQVTGPQQPPQQQQQQQASQQQQNQQQTQHLAKDVNPNMSQQSSMHIGLTMIPEESYGVNSTGLTSNTWVPSNTGFDQQVFAVTSVPDEPILNLTALGAKRATDDLLPFGSQKNGIPLIETYFEKPTVDLLSPSRIESRTEFQETNIAENDILELDESDPAFALYVDRPFQPTSSSLAQQHVDPVGSIFGNVSLEKGFSRIELTVCDNDADGAMEGVPIMRMARLRATMEALGARIDAVTAHL